jgi:hypothetical protein
LSRDLSKKTLDAYMGSELEYELCDSCKYNQTKLEDEPCISCVISHWEPLPKSERD